MPHRTLNDKREEMIQFLLENIVAKEIESIGNDIVFTSTVNRMFRIRTLSRQEEFPFYFKEDPKQFDNNLRKLQAICNEISFFVQEQNTLGYIPGFVLLQTDTDFNQLRNRTKPIVNEGHFLKQKLGPGKPTYNHKVLDPLELALYTFYHYNSINSGKKQGGRFGTGTYYHELIYFNPHNNKNIIEVITFANVGNPTDFRLDRCPVCKNPNGKDYNHQSCKSTRDYKEDYVKGRDEARYEKYIRITKRRGNDIEFKPAILDHTQLVLPSEQQLAVVR